ncbi:MAG: biotin--[acetyl-CoA-carboxylase] ligase [Woeseia sp.]
MTDDADDILQRINTSARTSLDTLHAFAELDSTNTWLLQQESPLRGRFRAVIAEHQTAGRGRDGKIWLSAPASGLCLSLAYTFAETPRNLPSLTLAIGVGLAVALGEIGVRDVALKWPNDLVAHDAKLGGILTEVHSKGGKGHTVVVGVGLNVDLSNAMRYTAPASWTVRITDLTECMGAPPIRAELAAAVIESLIDSVSRFERDGFGPFRSAWQNCDWLKGKTVRVQQSHGLINGIADGIDDDGALLIRTDTGTERVISGSVEVPAYGAACA